jgi:putative transposase
MLIIYLDGLVFGEHHVICAVGVDSQGRKHVLGVADGASENAASATSLLEDVVARGVDAQRRYLFVIDGSKALRAAINQVFGAASPLQRGRHHKIKNVCGKLPDDLPMIRFSFRPARPGWQSRRRCA